MFDLNSYDLDNLSYLIADTSNLAIIHTYKVGTRFINAWKNDDENESREFQFEYCPYRNIFTLEHGEYDIIKKLHQKQNVGKDILVIYRNPIQKTITGLVEDFSQSCLKLQNEIEFAETLSHIDNIEYKKIILDIKQKYISDMNKPNEESYSEFKHLFMDGEYIYDTDILAEKAWKEFFYAYVLYRMRTFTLSNRHSSFWSYPCYFLINEFLENNQNFYLLDLDNKSLSLNNFLNKYKSFDLGEQKYDARYSNDFFKKWAFDVLREKQLDIDIISRLQTEISSYHAIKLHKNNITSIES